MLDHITIVGLGAMGILFGDLAVKNLGPDHVRFLAGGDRLERYKKDGARCNGETCDFRFSDGSDGPSGLLIFAVKSPDLEAAMELAAPTVDENTVILSLLNGVTSEEILERRFGGEKVLYTVTQGMDAVRVGNELTYHSPGRMFAGVPQEDYFDRGEKLDAVLALLRRAGLPFQREEDILHRMWCKFMLNVGVNQVCMAFETDYGGVQQPGELRDLMIAAMDETRKVGACQGVLVTQKDRTEYLAVMDGLHPRGIPSMRQDGLAHRRTEVDLFAGAVLEMARRYGMNAPVNGMLYNRIKEMETSW
jgi:2-dehydropantoate 2-reductase